MRNELTLFHGFAEVVAVPMPGKGNPHNDYGPGFYCTENLELAKEWSCHGQELGVANEYLLHTDGLSILDLSDRKYNILNWLAILLENRTFDISLQVPRNNRKYILDNFLPDYTSADIISGYRADDSYFTYARDFLNNTIPLAQLQRAMKLGRLGRQITIKSQRAFDSLEFIRAHAVEGDVYYAKRLTRDRKARQDYLSVRDEGSDGDLILASDLVRLKITDHDQILR